MGRGEEDEESGEARNAYAMSLAMFEFWMDVQDFRSEPDPATLKESLPTQIRALLQASPDAARQQDSDSWTPLHHAIEQGASVRVLEALLKAWPGAER